MTMYAGVFFLQSLVSGATTTVTTTTSTVTSAIGPDYIAFTDFIPPTSFDPTEYDSGYNDYCDDNGTINTYRCVDKVIRRMEREYEALRATCDHRGVFALAYLETTKEFQRASLTPGFFDDHEFLNHEDVVFANLYFDAKEAWEEQDYSRLPPAWRLAFKASSEKRVSTLGDAMLGVSAHINRDLPITLATIGLVHPETGASRKPDHDRVNAFLARVQLDPAVQAGWDPEFSSGIPGVPTSSAMLSLIQLWREAAWRWAERLVEAETPEEEALVLQGIESYAYTEGLALLGTSAYLATQNSASRDAYCEANQ